MFGFQPNVKDDETLTIYFPWSYKAIDLKLEGK